MDSNLTADSELLSTLHDRQRRAERQVDKITLLEARRYGMAETQSNGRIKYTYAGHVFIYEPWSNAAITSYKLDPNRNPPGGQNQGGRRRKKKKDPTSGTKYFKPILIQESEEHEKVGVELAHMKISHHVRTNIDKWTSHTVLVVDMSGSMRGDDVDGARCRADGVWTSLARDFVKGQLENKTCSVYDVVSVIAMQERAVVLCQFEPLTYVLYNKLVKFRDWDNLKPLGHGFYKPALEKAEELLAINTNVSCALTLMFFSDGKPSDYHKDNDTDCFDWNAYKQVNDELVELTGNIASRFGRRLTIDLIGMAGGDEDFRTLERMAVEAKMFGSQATFNRPNLCADSISQIVNSSLASSLASKTELTSTKSGTLRSVRTDVERERQNAPDDRHVNSDWRIFKATSDDAYVQAVYSWNAKLNDFSTVIDPRCRKCYSVVADSKYQIVQPGAISCPNCKCCFFCLCCNVTGAFGVHRRSQECAKLAEARRSGFLVGQSKCPLAFSVAWKKKAFGEGAERLAFKFRFMDGNNNFIGPVMVAKESRFVEDLHDEDASTNYLKSHRHFYHKSFMRTQAAASKWAKQFNESVKTELVELHGVSVPSIIFVDPLIFELENSSTVRSYNVLVEPMIEGKYKKFSDNFGALAMTVKQDFSLENAGVDLDEAAMLLGRKGEKGINKPTVQTTNLGAIMEGSEDEEESDESEDERENEAGDRDWVDVSQIRDTDYLAAFSHYTYVHSRGSLMVVDLQGAFQKKKGGIKAFVLTDPAIHHKRKTGDKSRQYGRTDLGRQGMRAFFETHTCNGVCKLFNFREMKSKRELDSIYGPRKK